MEDAVRRKGVDGDLGPLDELFDQSDVRPRERDSLLDGRRKPLGIADEREAFLALAIRRLHHDGDAQIRGRLGHHAPGRLRDSMLCESLSLPQLGHGNGGGLR
jgi:hypothetical protein